MMPTGQLARARHRRAILFMIVAAICWSSGGILVRQLSITNTWEIVFWRSLFMAAFVAGVLLVMHGRRMPRAVLAVGRPGLLSGLFLSGTFFFFIASLTHTTVANTFVLMSVSPFLAAISGRLVLKEPVPARTWLAMAVAFAGIVVMFGDAIDSGRLLGNLLAFGVSICFAAQVTMLRKFHATVDMLPQVMIAGPVDACRPRFCWPGRSPRRRATSPSSRSWAACSLGAGCLLATAASRQPDRDRNRAARAARADHRAAVGLAADGRGPGRQRAAGRRHRARRRHRQRGVRRLARPRPGAARSGAGAVTRSSNAVDASCVAAAVAL